MGTLVLIASFCSVFLLGLNSKLLRDDHIIRGAIVSWFITVTQFALTWVVVHAGLSLLEYTLWVGLGGSAGITIRQYLYNWYSKERR